MGIFPFQSRIEHSRMDRAIKHFNDFCKLRGYVPLPDHGSDGNFIDAEGRHIRESSKPWLAKNGKSYTDREEFFKDTGWYPYLIKDGVCYGWAEPRHEDGYKDPWDEEVRFLTALGYSRHDMAYGGCNTSERNKLAEAYYKVRGFHPKWIKRRVVYGHPELLLQHRYKYTGEPEYPVLTSVELLWMQEDKRRTSRPQESDMADSEVIQEIEEGCQRLEDHPGFIPKVFQIIADGQRVGHPYRFSEQAYLAHKHIVSKWAKEVTIEEIDDIDTAALIAKALKQFALPT